MMSRQPQSKADRIRKLLHLTNAEIARRIGCRVEYVRAVRQRTSGSGNPITNTANRRWQKTNRERINAYMREWSRKRRVESRVS